jgi:hypothetical protein
MSKVTMNDLRIRAKQVEELAITLGLLEGGEWVDDIPAHLENSNYRFPHLWLDQGSATYGRAWRLNASGGQKYKTAHYDVFHMSSGYLGWTKAEAMQTLRGLEAGLWQIVLQKKREVA